MAEGGEENVAEKCDVFLVYSSKNNKIAEKISDALVSKKLTTFAQYKNRSFDVGKPIVDSIAEAIDASKYVLILLTPEAFSSHWVSLEILTGLEKSQSSGEMCIRLLLNNISEDEKKQFRDLENIPAISLDFNEENWIDNLVEKIKDKPPMSSILPAGNVAHGLVFNYFSGFLKHVLPDFEQKVHESDIYKQHGDSVLTKFIILMPESCEIKNLVGVFAEFVIDKQGALEITSGHGDKMRKYNTPVFRITKNGSESFYFLGECPTIMETMAKLSDSDYVEKFDKRLQVVRFRQTLEDLVSHKSMEHYNDTVLFVDYNDKEKSHAEEIWSAIKEVRHLRMVEHELIVIFGEIQNEVKVTIVHIDTEDDRATATEVMAHLQSNKFDFKRVESKSVTTYMCEARWNLFIVSGNSVRDTGMIKLLNEANTLSVKDNQVQVLSILTKNTNMDDIPKKHRWAKVLQSSDLDYLTTLWTVMKGHDIKMWKRMPAGKVYEGLAWAYMLNYLPINLCGQTVDKKGFLDRFKDAMVKYNVGYKCVAKVFVIVPKTCSFPPPGPFFEGEKHLGSIEPAVIGFRKYFLQFYRLTLENGEDVCYAREYATPAVTLYEMAHNFPSSGLSVDDMYTQSAEFAKFVETIINGEGFKKDIGDITDKCTVVYFKDDEQDLSQMTNDLKKRLSQCIVNRDFIAPITETETVL